MSSVSSGTCNQKGEIQAIFLSSTRWRKQNELNYKRVSGLSFLCHDSLILSDQKKMKTILNLLIEPASIS